jgi:hypothetical protein
MQIFKRRALIGYQTVVWRGKLAIASKASRLLTPSFKNPACRQAGSFIPDALAVMPLDKFDT